MKIGILKADNVRPQWVAEYGEYPDMFRVLLAAEDASLAFTTFDVQLGQYPGDIDEVDAYLLTGSKCSVYDDEPWIRRLEDFVRTLHMRQKKLVGICFGHQMVAHALGGETARSDKGWGVGVHAYQLHGRPGWHDGADSAFSLLVSHQDQVLTPAQGATVLGGSDFCEYAVCQVGEHILTFQGHPEFVPGYASALMTLRKELLGEEVYRVGMSSVNLPADSARVARWMLQFMRAA